MSVFRLLPERPDTDVLCVGGDAALTLGQLRADAGAVVQALQGVEPGEVLLACADRYHLLVALSACWQAGRVAALPPNLREATLAALQERSGTVATLTDVPRDGAINVAGLPAAQPLAHCALAGADRAVTLYTSGSTGDSSAHHKSFGQLLGEASMWAGPGGLGEACLLCTVPSHHIYGLLFGLLVPLAARGRFVRHTPLHASEVQQAAQACGADVLVSVPAHLGALTSVEGLGVARILSSGAPLPTSLAERLQSLLGVTVTEILGSTETGGIAAREPAGPWQPLSGVSLAVDETGHLVVTSPYAGGDTPMVTADQVSFHPDGSFDHLGRSGSVVKVGGRRVDTAELQARIGALENVTDVVVFARATDSVRGQELCCVVVGAQLQPATFQAKLRDALLPWYEPASLPRRWRLVDRLPRESTGKLPRRALEALFESHTDGSARHV